MLHKVTEKEKARNTRRLYRLLNRPKELRKLVWYKRWSSLADALDKCPLSGPYKLYILQNVDQLLNQAQAYQFSHIAKAGVEALNLVAEEREWTR